jgi:hypothetical protein
VPLRQVYRGALTRAGWKNVSHSANEVVLAHYAAGVCNICAYLHLGGDYTIRAADEGDLAAQLDRDCHVAAYKQIHHPGRFPTRPSKRPRNPQWPDPILKLEIQGHTDNVGSDEYNQKLSESRAASVVTWLTGKGIAQGRLTGNGYVQQAARCDQRQ